MVFPAASRCRCAAGERPGSLASADPETTKDLGDSPGPAISLWCSAHGTVPWPFRSHEGSHGDREKSTCGASAPGHQALVLLALSGVRPAPRGSTLPADLHEIGRASCRERVS